MIKKTTLLLFFVPFITQAATLDCAQIPKILSLLLKNHYLHHTLTDELKERTLDLYVKRLDPSKTILLEEDLAKIRQDLMKEFTSAETGDCSPLIATETLLSTRAAETEAFVKEFLNDKYKLDENTELIIDPKKRSFPKNPDEKKEILRKMLHFQISNLLLSKVKLPEARKQIIHRYELITRRLKNEKVTELIAHYADAFANGLDPHSNFMSPDEVEDLQIQMRLSLEGIGASLRQQDGFTVVESLVKGGSADRAKVLKPKDKIIVVAQENAPPISTIDMDLREVVKMIRGKKGTKVILTILRQKGGKTSTFDTTFVRDKIDVVDQAAKITYEKSTVNGKSYNIGIIDLPSFYGTGERGGRSCSADMEKLLLQAREKKVDGIVLNLSHNGGGLLGEAVKISGLFIKRGAVVATKDSRSAVEVLDDKDDYVVYNGPLVVLTSRLSASASEILAGALKDYHRAVIIGGDHTFGKGSVQALSDLPDGLGGMKVTQGMFFVPGGQSTQMTGVSSDVVLPSALTGDEVAEKALDYALPPQKIAPFVSSEANSSDKSLHWAPITSEMVTKLTQNSAKRVAKHPKFIEIEKQIQKTKNQDGVVKLSEVRKEDLKKKKKDPVEGDDAEPDDDSEKKAYSDEAVHVLIDLIGLEKA